MRDEWPTPRDVVAVDRGGVRAEVRRPGRVVNGNAADLQWALAEAIERRADLLEQFDTITTDQRLLQLAELRQPDHLALELVEMFLEHSIGEAHDGRERTWIVFDGLEQAVLGREAGNDKARDQQAQAKRGQDRPPPSLRPLRGRADGAHEVAGLLDGVMSSLPGRKTVSEPVDSSIAPT